MEVPTVLSPTRIALQIDEQIVETPVPQGRGGQRRVQGSLPGQSTTATHSSGKRISERIVEQIVDFPEQTVEQIVDISLGGGLGQGSASSAGAADEDFTVVFRTFLCGKESAEVAGQVSARVPPHSSSWTMKLWDISGDGGFWNVQLDVRDLGGHLDFTLRARAGTLSKRIREATCRVASVGALPLGFQVKLNLVRGKYLLAGLHAAEPSYVSSSSISAFRAAFILLFLLFYFFVGVSSPLQTFLRVSGVRGSLSLGGMLFRGIGELYVVMVRVVPFLHFIPGKIGFLQTFHFSDSG